MPSHGSTTIADLINTAMGVQSLLLQRRSLAERERQQLASRIASFQSIGSQIDRPSQELLASQFEEQGLVGTTDLEALFGATAQEPAAVQARTAERGTAALPAEDQTLLDREAAINQITGGGSLELALAGQAGELSTEELLQATRANLGVGLTANQAVDAEIRNASLGLNWIDITQRSALGEASLATRLQIADLDNRIGLARILAQNNDDVQAVASLNTFASLSRNLEANRTGLSETDILSSYIAMRVIFQRLNAAGYPVPPDLFDEEIAKIQRGGVSTSRPWWERLKRIGAR